MGRRRRKPINKSKQYSVPNVFQCPTCGVKAIKVQIDKKLNLATVKCGNCKISDEVKLGPLMEPIDVFGKFIDQHFENLKNK